ncbi:hypothetical protein ACFQZ4_37680 [Catellatospora coxensis]
MAVNFLLTDARGVPDDDPLGRSWVGWRPDATDDELWEVNRGLWTLGRPSLDERFATLSYDGCVQVVAEITGRTTYEVDGRRKWALQGTCYVPATRCTTLSKDRSPRAIATRCATTTRRSWTRSLRRDVPSSGCARRPP